jgi:serine/threonine protein kinase
VKVFKLESISLHDLQHQLPQGLMQSNGVDVGLHSCIMWQSAQGMHELQLKHIPHRDLKAANVLILPFPNRQGREWSMHCPIHSNEFTCHVVAVDLSVRVVGTRFSRAPEMLYALQDIRNSLELFSERALKDMHNNPELFSERADVYSYNYAMTCYKALTGRIPFEDLPRT